MTDNELVPTWADVVGPGQRRPTEAECIRRAGEVFAAADLACSLMTPREQAEAAWTPTSTASVDEIEDRIRVRRGLPPIHGGRS